MPGSRPGTSKTLPALFGNHAASSSSRTLTPSSDVKRRRNDAHDELEQAIALSAREAELASMDDEAQLQAALQASLQDHPKPLARSNNEGSEEEASTAVPAVFLRRKRIKDATPDPIGSQARVKEGIDAASAPTLDRDAFDEDNETAINRLEGSLDLLYCKSWLRPAARLELREWMLTQLAWHRVSYVRPRTTMRIVTPRFTATFGRDDTGAPDSAYTVPPKPFPPVLRQLCDTIEQKTGAHFNAMIINYYADGRDSISYHSDDEAFLGKLPTIASISLGAARDFYLRRKAPASQAVPDATPAQKMGTKGSGPAATRPIEKFRLEDGDLLVMRGRTQADWEHSIPKRTTHVGGRINITFRRVINVSGTNSECASVRSGP